MRGNLKLEAPKHTQFNLMFVFLFQSNSRLLYKRENQGQLKNQRVTILGFKDHRFLLQYSAGPSWEDR